MQEQERKTKQVIVFRHDLLKGEHAIRRGKFAAQCNHASLGALLQTFTKTEDYDKITYTCTFDKDSVLDKWLNGIFTKIVLSVENEDELVVLYERIKKENPYIPCVMIEDNGLTEFHGEKTKTCIGIGPFWSDEIDKFTKNLKLL